MVQPNGRRIAIASEMVLTFENDVNAVAVGIYATGIASEFYILQGKLMA